MKEPIACFIMFIVCVGGHFFHNENSHITLNALTGLALFFGFAGMYLDGKEFMIKFYKDL